MTKTFRLLSTTALGLAATAAPALAQDVILLDEIVASASLTPVIAGETGATVDALSSEDIATGDLSAAAQIDRLPGTSLSSSGGLGQVGSLRLRGLNDFYIVTRIDGIDVSDPSNPQTFLDFGSLHRGGLDRIELLKGSQSALYGSQAIAGVIDMQTYKAEAPGRHWRAQVEAGSNDTYAASLGVANRTERGGLAFNISRITTGGISAAASGTERDGFDETFLSLSGDVAATETVTLGFAALYADSRVDYDNGFPVEDADFVNDNTRKGARLYAVVDQGAIEHELSLSTFVTERLYPDSLFAPYFEGRRVTAAYTGTAALDWGRATFGAEYVREEADIGEVRQTRRRSVFGEVLLDRGALDLSLAARFDHSDDFGGNVSGRLAAAYEVSPGLTLKAVAGTGFRAPSLDERFAGYGNPNLDVETSQSFELGVVRDFANGAAFEATAFYTQIDNRIDFDFASVVCPWGPGCYEQVDARTFSRGVEIAAEVPIGERVDLWGSYTYTDAERQGARLRRVPLHDLVLGVDVDVMAGVTASADLTHVAGKPNLADYTLLGAGLDYAVTENATAYLRVDNIADEDYQTVEGYAQPGRTFTVGLRAEF